MNADFPRILSLLRKEKGISQKEAAARLGISQALLSHYEKGIRECGLDFLVRCADFYSVSCDYLLGRSPDRDGSQITIDNIPDPDSMGKENSYAGSILPTLNKKLIANSLNILFDLLSKAECESLTKEVSSFIMLSVYRMFRLIYSVYPKNQAGMFAVPDTVARQYADGSMQISEANAYSIANGQVLPGLEKISNPEVLSITTQSLSKDYPLFSSSLLNLISNTEKNMGFKTNTK